MNLELVTLTEATAVITWYTGHPGTDDGLGRMQPAAADGVVQWGTHLDRLRRSARSRDDDTLYHVVELKGLEPGETYYYRARSNGVDARPTPFDLIAGNAVGTSDFGLAAGGPYSFTVPKPPPGKFLFSVRGVPRRRVGGQRLLPRTVLSRRSTHLLQPHARRFAGRRDRHLRQSRSGE